MRLTRWQRAWVVFSVLWIVAAAALFGFKWRSEMETYHHWSQELLSYLVEQVPELKSYSVASLRSTYSGRSDRELVRALHEKYLAKHPAYRYGFTEIDSKYMMGDTLEAKQAPGSSVLWIATALGVPLIVFLSGVVIAWVRHGFGVQNPSHAADMPEKLPSDVFLEQYKAASAEGSVIELKLRLLADKIPELQTYSHAQRHEDIETELSRYFGSSLSEDDKQTLCLCRQLRNKILHCNFSVARNKLRELGIETPRDSVKKVSVSGLSAAQIAENIAHTAAGTEDTFVYVADTETTEPGNVFGWLLEMGASGDFLRAIQQFKKAAVIVDRLAIARVVSVGA